MEPVTTLTAAVIADLAFRKFIESGAGELAKKFTEGAIVKMDALRQKIWDKLRGSSTKLDEALDKAQTGDLTSVGTIAKYLDVAMEDYPDFAEEVRGLVQEIHAGKIQDNSSMVMNVSDQATGYQTRNEVTNQGGENYTGNITINKHFPAP